MFSKSKKSKTDTQVRNLQFNHWGFFCI
ncbi:hypothetical protein [Psychrobacter sp. AOP7-B1-24]